MRCKKFKSSMERFRDKILSAQRQSACEKHLATCSQCSLDFADIDKMKSLFIETSIPSAPDSLTADIMRIVRNSAYAKNRGGNLLTQWWKEAAIPARLALSVVLFFIIGAGIFAGKDLWNASNSQAFAYFIELDAFSESQKGSLEEVYLQMIQAPKQGDQK
jgi:anti-sigma factor RsiW